MVGLPETDNVDDVLDRVVEHQHHGDERTGHHGRKNEGNVVEGRIPEFVGTVRCLLRLAERYVQEEVDKDRCRQHNGDEPRNLIDPLVVRPLQVDLGAGTEAEECKHQG
jgi:hypothetical protein